MSHQERIIPAKSLADLYNELRKNHFQGFNVKDKAMHVPLFEDIIKQLRVKLLISALPSESFYLIGQTATG